MALRPASPRPDAMGSGRQSQAEVGVSPRSELWLRRSGGERTAAVGSGKRLSASLSKKEALRKLIFLGEILEETVMTRAVISDLRIICGIVCQGNRWNQ